MIELTPIDPSAAGEQPGFEFISHYLRDLSFEAPSGPCPPEQFPNIELKRQVQISVTPRGGDLHEVSLALYATGTLEGRTLILCELTYAAVVRLHLIPDAVAPQILSVSVPEVMLPHVQQLLAGNSLLAGFPALELGGIDFLSVYQEAEASGRIKPLRSAAS